MIEFFLLYCDAKTFHPDVLKSRIKIDADVLNRAGALRMEKHITSSGEAVILTFLVI